MHTTNTLPLHLHAAHDWTDAAGELEELRVLTGDRLAEYCLESATNAREHDEDVSASDLRELSGWLKMDHVRRMAPGEAWDTFVGGQSTSEFVANCHGEPIEEACSQYLREMRKAASDWDLDDVSEAYVARLLVRHIQETGAA